MIPLALAVGLSLLSLSLPGCAYIAKQAEGQLKLLAGRVPIEQALEEVEFSPKERELLDWLPRIKAFGEEVVGLKPTPNYMTINPDFSGVIWNVSAAAPDRFLSHRYNYPVVGALPYIGFWDKDDAKAEVARLQALGWETYMRTAGAYSTLGWFRDPLWRSMLAWDFERFVNTVLHELAHATLWLPGQGKFNESFKLLAMNLVVATSTAMVIVNTVVLVQGLLGRPQTDVALLLAAYGAGSMVVALGLPKVLDRIRDLKVMLAGAIALPVGLVAAAIFIGMPASTGTWGALIATWFYLGAATSLLLTPSARLLRRASDVGTRPAVFAAQFSLSHACFIITYPLAGTLGALLGLPAVALVLAAIGTAAAALAWLGARRASSPAGSELAQSGA